MNNRTKGGNNVIGFFRARERTLVVTYVICFVLFGTLIGIGARFGEIRQPALDRVQQIIDYWDDRWTRRVEYGERLVNAKRYPQAVEYLTDLDRVFPAQHVKHKRDSERERILRLLGRSYSELGRKRLALETYRRLIAFDPRNFQNHYLFATTCLQFNELAMAENSFSSVLAIHPTHMPSNIAYLKIQFDKANFAGVTRAYETFLDAFLLQRMVVTIGGSSAEVNVPVNGRFHNLDVRLAQLPNSPDEMKLDVGEFSVEIKQVTLQSPLLVGKTGVTAMQVWPSKNVWKVNDMAPIDTRSFRALGSNASLRLDIPPVPDGIAVIQLALRLFKPIDRSMWDMVKKSYENQLKYKELEAVRAKTIVSISGGGML